MSNEQELLKQILVEQKKTNDLLQVITSNEEQRIRPVVNSILNDQSANLLQLFQKKVDDDIPQSSH